MVVLVVVLVVVFVVVLVFLGAEQSPRSARAIPGIYRLAVFV